MKSIVAFFAVFGAAFAATDDCAQARAIADKFVGNCDVVRYCKGLSANTGSGANAGAISNDGFVGNAAMAPGGEFDGNEAFLGNLGESNDGMLSNEGFSNEAFLGNAGESNDGTLSNEGFSNEAFLGNGGESNDGFGNDGLANDGAIGANMASMAPAAEVGGNDAFIADVDADVCASLDTCGVFNSEDFIKCAVDVIPAGCIDVYIGDGVCDEECDDEEHDFDGGDCL